MKTWKSLLPRGHFARRITFNGATSMKTWKSWSSNRPWLTSICLQWGHVNEDVEERKVVLY